MTKDFFMLELYLIRHGRSTWNQTGRIQGHTDVPLSEEGEKQAQALAKRLKHWKFDRVYSSDLQRAKQTAEAVYPSGAITFDTRLREIHLGDFEGRTWDDMTDQERDVFAVQFAGPYHHKVPGGESNDDLRDRALAWLAELPKEGRVVAFTHGGFIVSILHSIVGRPEPRHWKVMEGWGFWIENTSITQLLIDKKFKTIHTVGDFSHLETLKEEKEKLQHKAKAETLEKETKDAKEGTIIR
jgi:2,3-bisphosphoglycerate-dependent phosphoglycerate mutase